MGERAFVREKIDNVGGEMDARYATTDGRKIVYRSLNPVKLLKNANLYTYIALIFIVVVIAAVVLVIRPVIRRRRRKRVKAEA